MFKRNNVTNLIMEQLKDVEGCLINFENFMRAASTGEAAPETLRALESGVVQMEAAADRSLTGMIESLGQLSYRCRLACLSGCPCNPKLFCIKNSAMRSPSVDREVFVSRGKILCLIAKSLARRQPCCIFGFNPKNFASLRNCEAL